MKRVIFIIILMIAFIFTLCAMKVTKDKEIVENNETNIVEDEIVVSLADEELLESEGFEEIGNNLVFGATNVNTDYYKNRLVLASPVYFSQIDSRWKNIQYSSVGNSSQTIGSSGCGPTSAAMVVSSVTNKYGDRFTIYPNEMASLYVSHGFRSADNGTYFSAFEWTAETFDIDFARVNSTYDMADKINEGYYAIVSCSNGLFTTGGHYIVVYGRDGDTLKIYDPYLYTNKFNSYGRGGKVTQSGNTVYCTINNFKAYANAKAFFLFKNNSGETKPEEVTPIPESSTDTNTIMYVNTQSKNLNLRSTPGGTVIGSVTKGTKVTVDQCQGSWSHIVSPVVGWVSSDYLGTNTVPTPQTNTSTSGTYKLKQTSYIYSNSNLTGTKYTYKANTTITVLANINDSVDYIKVNQTGRVGYIDNSNYKTTSNSTSSTSRNTVGQYKRLNQKCNLYSNSNLTGTKYTYLVDTQIKILSNVSNNVDYVYVVKTGRKAYINTCYYK